MNIAFTYSAWWLLPGFIAAAGLSMFLYYRDDKFKDVKKSLIYCLAFLRFTFIFSLIVLLLQPTIEFVNSETKLPLFILLQDNSQSITKNSDSVFYKNDYPQKINDLQDKLSAKFNVKTLVFGDTIQPSDTVDFSDQLTDMSVLSEAIDIRYNSSDVAAVFLATDGLYNAGLNPLSKFENAQYPVYTLALGDTTQQRDVLIKEAKYNKLAFLNNRFQLRVYFHAWEAKNQSLKFFVKRNGVNLLSKEILADSDQFQSFIDIELTADELGLQIYNLGFETLDGEVSVDNNIRDIVINVIDNQQEIFLLARAPHPDIAAIRRALEGNLNFSVKTHFAEQLFPNLDKADLIIVHDLPSSRFPMSELFKTVRSKNIPVLFVFGENTNYRAFNTLGFPLGVKLKSAGNDFAQAYENTEFNRFEIQSSLLDIQSNLPPLVVPFADYTFASEYEILMHQQISSIKTEKPLIVFTASDQVKNGFVMGTGIWQWRLSDYRFNGNTKAFDDLLNKTAQYLVSKKSSKQFNVRTKQLFSSIDNIQIEAELYNQAWELTNTPDAVFVLTDSSDNSVEYSFQRGVKSYKLNLGSLNAGKYSWKAYTTFDNSEYVEQGAFVVNNLSLEALKLKANHKLLNTIAVRTNAEMIYPAQLNAFADDILKAELSKPRIVVKREQSSVVEFKWILFILIGWISLEWFLRKLWGTY